MTMHLSHATHDLEHLRYAVRITSDPAIQAFWILRAAFALTPIVAGLDKFTNLLTDWTSYLAPFAKDMLGPHVHTFMQAVGVIEIIAGIGVAIVPRIFGYVVAAWLLAVIANLLMIPGYLDVALRDLGLALGALALARLSLVFAAQ